MNKFSEAFKESTGYDLNIEPLSLYDLQKLYICSSKDELNKVVESAENLMLQYTVKKYNERLWHVSVLLA